MEKVVQNRKSNLTPQKRVCGHGKAEGSGCTKDLIFPNCLNFRDIIKGLLSGETNHHVVFPMEYHIIHGGTFQRFLWKTPNFLSNPFIEQQFKYHIVK